VNLTANSFGQQPLPGGTPAPGAVGEPGPAGPAGPAGLVGRTPGSDPLRSCRFAAAVDARMCSRACALRMSSSSPSLP
jgi:hypothetical protein